MAFWLGTMLPEKEIQIIEKVEYKEVPVATPLVADTDINNISADIETKPATDLEVRIEQTKQWLENAADDDFTIQLVLMDASTIEKVTQYLETAKQNLDIKNIYVYQAYIRGKDMFSVLYSSYADWDTATAQLRELPGKLRQSGPYLRTVKGIRADIRKSNEYIKSNGYETGVRN